jgi:hypothetical protein
MRVAQEWLTDGEWQMASRKEVNLIPKDKWWLRLPSDLQYLRRPATIYTGGPMGPALDRFLREITPALRDELADWYSVIGHREDSFRISAWLHSASPEDMKFGCYWPILCMFQVFDELGSRGEWPFVTRQVRYIEKGESDPRWERVPAEMQYLVPFAKRFGAWVSEDDLDNLVKLLPTIDMAQLAKLGSRLRAEGGARAITEWLRRDDNDCTTEGRHVYQLLGAMDACGIEID